MYKQLPVNPHINRENSIKAGIYTACIAAALLLIVLFVKFHQPLSPVPVPDDFVEINLGSADDGSGTDQPELPGAPAPEPQQASAPAEPQVSQNTEAVKDVEESDDKEAAPVYKPPVSRPDAKKLNKETKPVTKPAPAVVANPAPPRPKAAMGQVRGGEGSGGNGATTYKPGTGEGNGNVPGDRGSVGGNPNGNSYTPRRLSVRTVSIPAKNFEDDFKESGKIVLEITVDANGRLQSATFQPRGSSISNRGQIDIAKRRAQELTYPKYPEGFKQNVEFGFEVKN